MSYLDDLIRYLSGGPNTADNAYDAMGNATGMAPGILSNPQAQAAPQQPQAPQRPPMVQRPQLVGAPAPAVLTQPPPQEQPQQPQQPQRDELAFETMVARAMAAPPVEQFAVNPQDVAAGPQQGPQGALNMPQYEQGILSKIGDFGSKLMDGSKTGVSPLEHIFRGLGAAGSQDPMKAMAQYASQDTEMEKVREARRRAMMPKRDPIAGTPVTQITYADGTVKEEVSPLLQRFYADEAKRKLLEKQNTVDYTAEANEAARRRGEIFKSATTEAGGATTDATYSPTVQRSVAKLDGIIAEIPAINTTTFPLGMGSSTNPLIAGGVDAASGALGVGTAGFKVRRDLEKYYNEQVAADLKQLGSNPTDTDLRFKQKPIPKAGDPIEYQIEYIKELRERLNESENRRVSAAKKRDELSSGAARPAAASTDAIRFPDNPDKLPEVSSPADMAKYKGKYIMTPGGRKFVPN